MGGRGHVWQGVVHFRECARWGVAGGHAWRGGGGMAGETVTEAGSTHPTGMNSCLSI